MNIRTITRLAIVAGLTVAMAACADDGNDAGLAGPAGPAVGAGAASASSTALSPGSVVDFHATEFSFAPMELTAEPGTYSGRLINDGTIAHDITFGEMDPDRKHAMSHRAEAVKKLRAALLS